MKNNCWLCGGTRNHEQSTQLKIRMDDAGIRYEVIGFTCAQDVLREHILDFESKDKAMSERMNRHEANREEKEDSIIDSIFNLPEKE